jgi:hypothetical protein
VLVREAVFETVRSVAFVAVHARHKWRIYQCLAIRIRALLLVGEDIGFRGERGGALRSAVGGCALLRPFAGFGAFVGRFGAVVQAEFAERLLVEGFGGFEWLDWTGNVPYPLQLSHLKGKRSSWRQKGIWQCAPIASTSPVDILLNDSSVGLGVLLPDAMLSDGVWVLI